MGQFSLQPLELRARTQVTEERNPTYQTRGPSPQIGQSFEASVKYVPRMPSLVTSVSVEFYTNRMPSNSWGRRVFGRVVHDIVSGDAGDIADRERRAAVRKGEGLKSFAADAHCRR